MEVGNKQRALTVLAGIMTVLLALTGIEVLARHEFYISQTSAYSCMVLDDVSTGARGVPNSTCWEKSYENQLVRYDFNDCGDRAGPVKCQKPSTGRLRIVMTGSSFAFGSRVRREDRFAAQLPGVLSRQTGKSIELYNASIMAWGTPRVIALHMNRIVRAKPDLIFLIITPWDIENADVLLPAKRSSDAGRLSKFFSTADTLVADRKQCAGPNSRSANPVHAATFSI